jgi:hypothetical protein
MAPGRDQPPGSMGSDGRRAPVDEPGVLIERRDELGVSHLSFRLPICGR